MRFAKNTQHDKSKVLRLPRKMTSEVSNALRLPRKMQRIFWKCGKGIVPATQNDVRHVTKDVETSQSATPATRNEAMRRWKAPRVTPFAKLPIGTCYFERLRTAATVAHRLANTTQPPQGTLATHSGKAFVTCLKTGTSLHTFASGNMTLVRWSSAYALSSSGGPQHSQSPCHMCCQKVTVKHNQQQLYTRHAWNTVREELSPANIDLFKLSTAEIFPNHINM